MRTTLLPHNQKAYKKVVKAFETSNRTCVVHPTGTGKSYLIAAVSESYDNVLILCPNNFVLDQVHSVLQWRKSGVTYMTYSKLTRSGYVDHYDLIVLDEFHRAGAEEWGDAVGMLLSDHSQAKVFGTTATPIRHLDGERDMSDEIFDGNVASELSIVDAWTQNILPIPTYVTGLFDIRNTIGDAVENIRSSKRLTRNEKEERISKLTNIGENWEQSEGMPAIIRKHIDKDCRRILVFCSNIDTLQLMGDIIRRWFVSAGIKVSHIFMLHNKMTDREQREAMQGFENDDNDGIRIMMSVDMLNEGVHVPRVGAVIMLRTTQSRILFMQQMGRCLTASNTERPVVLDMVDNIKNVSVIHEFKREYDRQQSENSSNEEKCQNVRKTFYIYDYTKSFTQLINELQRGAHREYLTIEELRQKIIEFVQEHDRWPLNRVSVQTSRYEKILARRFLNKKKQLLADPQFKKTYEYYWSKNRPSFDKCYQNVISFCQKKDRMPKNNIPEELSIRNQWAWLRKNYNDDERVKDIQRQYSRKSLRENEIKRRIKILTAFVDANHRRPNSYHKDEVTMQGYLNQFSSYRHRKDVQQMFEHFDKLCKQTVPEEKIMDEYRAFCLSKKKIPSRHSHDPEEVKLYNLSRCRKNIVNSEEFKQLNEKYKKRRLSAEEEERIVLEYCKKNGRRPSKKTSDPKVFRAWSNIKRTNKPLADRIRQQCIHQNKLSYGEICQRAQQIIQFVKTNGRRPRYQKDGKYNNMLYSILDSNNDNHPDVIKLKETLKNIPAHIPYTREQTLLRRYARNRKYKLCQTKSNTKDDSERFTFYYTPETKRSESFEVRCKNAGINIIQCSIN